MRALVTGAAGQDGTILSTQLRRDGLDVVGLVKPGTDTVLLSRYVPDITVVEADLGDADALRAAVIDAGPTEVYNLGGFTAPGESWDHQDEVRRINVDAVAVLLESIARVPGARFFQASSASIFEGADRSPQTERSERVPRTPYAHSKSEAMNLVNAARDRGVHAVCGILYNHESPLRGEGFVTRRITMAVARIAAGLQDIVELGDIETARDWGWAPDYTRAMQLMLRADVPHDYVLATGISHRLSFFLAKAFAAAGIDDWRPHVVSSQGRTRAGDTNILVGDSRAAYLELGWRHTVDFDSMAGLMVRHDVALLANPDALWQIPVTDRKVSYAQNAEDVRVWRAFRNLASQEGLTYVDVGANEPRHLSITASLSALGWSGLLVEADPELAEELRVHRPADTVVQMAAADGPGELVFFRVPGTGLGTLDEAEAEAAGARGFAVEQVRVATDSIDAIMQSQGVQDVHFMSVDVEGAESIVLQGLSLDQVRPWILCVEAVLPGTTTPSHQDWEPRLLERDYRFVAFDGVNRWYVSGEHAELGAAVAIPFNAVDAGEHGWVIASEADQRRQADRASVRRAWQRELILNDIRGEVPKEEYEKQIAELRGALIQVEGSRTWKYSRKVARVGKAVLHRSRAFSSRMPASLQQARVRRRHLKHVTVNMGHLTPPDLMSAPERDAVTWLTPDGLPQAPVAGLGLESLTPQDADVVREWLADPHDSDDMLVRRTDNHGDELGRARAALRLRLALANGPAKEAWAGGDRVLFDARCLQTAAFGTRGIGRFARAALSAAREAVGDERLDLLVDRGLDELTEELAGRCRQVTRIDERDLPSYGVLVQPSPMTASARLLLPVLHSTAVKIAVVFDFIPKHHPTIYLRDVASRAEYAAALDALRMYDEFVCISQLVQAELGELLGRPADGPGGLVSQVAWPRDVMPSGSMRRAGSATGPIVVMTGDDARKNTFGGLAGVAAATAGELSRDVVVIGMAGTGDRVHHWSIAAAMRPGEARTVERISDDEMDALLADASVVVVPSFDEGLSLPVIEALRAGSPVVASDIPAHRELIGAGSFLADPRSPGSIAGAVRATAGKSGIRDRQLRRLQSHRHAELETVIADRIAANRRTASVDIPAPSFFVGGRPLSVGIGTPWPPQRTGIADFTAATVTELARLCDVTVYTTADADVAGSVPVDAGISAGRIDDVIARGHSHDVFVSVVGNSHFHLPFIEAVDTVESVVLAHDTRLVELYLALRGRGGVEQVMLRGKGRRSLAPPLDEQIDDLRLLESTALWEVARRARVLLGHTPTAAGFIEQDTGVPMHLLPFANYRRPSETVITAAMRAAARQRLGLGDDTVHLASFGFIDTRTKLSDVVVEAAAWLSQWGRRVSLQLVGSAPEPVEAELRARAAEAGIERFEITGFVSDETFRDYVIGIDLGVQLRVSPLLGVSGPLSDMAAYGTPAVANRGLCADVDTPAFVDRLPDDVSPVMVAEAIDSRLSNPWPAEEIEAMRVDYLERKSPQRYARELHDVLMSVATSAGGA